MARFIYKKSSDITALSASFTDFTYKKHCHEEYALGVTLRGIQEYNLDGSFHASYENGVMLFNPEQIHDGRAHDSSGLDYVMLYIEPRLFLDILGKKDMVRFAAPVVYNQALRNSILNLSNAIQREEDKVLCSELLLSLVDNFNPINIFIDYKRDNKLIHKAKEMIYSKLDDVMSLDEICKEFSISKYQFIRLFKANAGISPYQYFIFCKVNRAKQLLEKNKDIYSAVAECGFVDLSHLNKHFKRIYGITAFEYKSHLNMN
ncbi:AraC family transcriptional regulator [Sporomusa termitida]|uniref:HTH-type transcriptional activator RhaR n=1 Tax=Sporomusa termitida TaxID=2377 RepID=A0A517DV57_9FIRM|nr:AraC family transcriptional regulator [Sporomusa termitida]QDR81242.1 HTH-type transcriptional activator RhaR [Sporomusa termitida]